MSLQCCTALEQVSRERSVWIDKIRRLIFDLQLSTASYSIPSMSTRELEHVAVCHVRFQSSARRASLGTSPLPPLCQRSIRPATPYQPFETVKIVPGGRLFLTVAGGQLELWALPTMNNPAGQRPIATIPCRFGKDSQFWISIHPARGDHLTVSVTEAPIDES